MESVVQFQVEAELFHNAAATRVTRGLGLGGVRLFEMGSTLFGLKLS